jgi:hypothetical protein
MVSQFTIKDPAQLANDDGRVISSIQYANRDGEPKSAVVITPTIDLTQFDKIIDITSVDDERDI